MTRHREHHPRTASSGRSRSHPRRLAALALALATAAAPTGAVQPQLDPLPPTILEFERSVPAQGSFSLPPASGDASYLGARKGGWARYLTKVDPKAILTLDLPSGSPSLVVTRMPWVPGGGNKLKPEDLKPILGYVPAAITRDVLDALARNFVNAYSDLLGLKPGDLLLPPGDGTAPVDEAYAELGYGVSREGVPIDGALLFFRINHGNLVHFGVVGVPLGPLSPVPPVSDATALLRLRGYIAPVSTDVDLAEPTRLIAEHTDSLAPATPAMYRQALLMGRPALGLRLVWLLRLLIDGDGPWEARVDATRGDILSFHDGRLYGDAVIGAYSDSNLDPPRLFPAPFMVVRDGAGVELTSASGQFATTAVPTVGDISVNVGPPMPFVNIDETCIPGNPRMGEQDGGSAIHFGYAPAGNTNCTWPALRPPFTSMAGHNVFVHVNRSKDMVRNALPGGLNPPLFAFASQNLTARVNLTTRTCNADWNGATINFYQATAACANTGEITDVFLHELGHGYDSRDGVAVPPLNVDGATGEAYGDCNAFFDTRDSCIGEGFLRGGPRPGLGTCTGVRNMIVVDAAGTRVLAQPSTLPLAPYGCPTNPGYTGRLGYQAHCESSLNSQSVWDLANTDLASEYDAATAWQIAERLFYRTRGTTQSAYARPGLPRCTVNDDTCINGCGGTAWYSAFLAADDDDGNPSTVSPNADHIYNAFRAHSIACGLAVPVPAPCDAALPAMPGVTNLTVTPDVRANDLTWDPHPNATLYDVFYNVTSCDDGLTPLATVSAPATSFRHDTLMPGVTYNYRVQPIDDTVAACVRRGSLGDCKSAAPRDNPRVGTNGAACLYQTIQEALATGDTDIFISAGTYYERLGTLAGTVNLRSATADCTAAAPGAIIDSMLGDRVATVTGTVGLYDLQVRAGRAPAGGNGGAIAVLPGGALTVRGGSISGSDTTGSGGGIHVDGGSLSLTNVTVSGNTAGVSGGGIAAVGGATVTMATDFGTCDPATLPFEQYCSQVRGNRAGAAGWGGGLHVDGSNAANVLHTAFIDNRAGGGAAVSLANNGDAHLEHCLMTANVGGAPGNDVVHVTSTGSLFYSLAGTYAGNTVTATIRSDAGTQLNLADNIIWDGVTGVAASGLVFASHNDSNPILVGLGNINAAPVFEAAHPRGAFHLEAGSPGVDQTPFGMPIDLEGDPRPVGSGFDMGAFERQ